MTYLDVAFRYGTAPAERAMQAIDGVREVYASRLTEDGVAKLLRQAGIDVRDKLALA